MSTINFTTFISINKCLNEKNYIFFAKFCFCILSLFFKEIENDKALIKYLEAQKAAGAALDTTAYESYDAWIDTIKKQIKKSESTLTNIEFKKVELEAVNQYLA